MTDPVTMPTIATIEALVQATLLSEAKTALDLFRTKLIGRLTLPPTNVDPKHPETTMVAAVELFALAMSRFDPDPEGSTRSMSRPRPRRLEGPGLEAMIEHLIEELPFPELRRLYWANREAYDNLKRTIIGTINLEIYYDPNDDGRPG